MQDPNEDTEWNDVLRAKGIIPEKPKEKEVTEDEIVNMLEKTIKEKSGGMHKSFIVLVIPQYLSDMHKTPCCVQKYLTTSYAYLYANVSAKDMEDMTLDELDELEDDEEERVLEQYRQQRMAQIKALQQKSRYFYFNLYGDWGLYF